MAKLGTYLVNGVLGDENMPGAPLLHFSLVVVSATGKVAGHAVISQAIAAPYDEKQISNVTGQIHATGLGPITKIVALEGTYTYSAPPPAIGTFQMPFQAHFGIDDSWNGKGGFTCGATKVENAPVKKVQM